MKLLLFTQNIYSLGGVQRVVCDLCNYLVKKDDISIDIIMPNNYNGKKFFNVSRSINIIDIRTILSKKNIFRKMILSFNKRTGILDKKIFNRLLSRQILSKNDKEKLMIFLNRNNYDFVVGTGAYNTILISLIGDEVNSKVIGWQHSTFDAYFYKKNGKKSGYFCLSKECYKKLDTNFVLTESDKKIFDRNFDINSIVLYNPVSDYGFSIMNRCLDNTILFVGRLDEECKGLSHLVAISKKLKERNIKFSVSIVGDGPDRDYLDDLIKRNELIEVINCVGSTNQIYDYYSNSKLLVQTSNYEGFGMTIVEAMSCGVPVVSFHNFGPDAIINNEEDGFLIEKYDYDEFVDKLELLLTDKKLYSKMSKNSIEKAKLFSLERVSREFLEGIGYNK